LEKGYKNIVVAFLIDTISCDTAGTQKQLIEIISRLKILHFKPQIICLYSSEWLENHKLSCPVTVLGYRGLLKANIFRVIWSLRKIIRRERVDILQTFFEDSIFIAFFSVLGLNRKRCFILTSRRDIGLGSNRPWYHRLFNLVLPIVIKRYDGIVANGEEIKKWVIKRERVVPGKIRIIPNGICIPGPSNYQPEIFKKYPGCLWIGLVANLTPIKRIDVFIKALKIIFAERPDINFRALVFGEGPERNSMTELIRTCGLEERVHLFGVVKDVGSFLHNIDIGVLCSDREGFSNSVLEYMAHKLPIVVTDVGGNKEIIDDSNGFRVPPGDYHALSCALIRLADNPSLRVQMGTAGCEKIKNGYSWERSMAELEGFYTSLIRTRHASSRILSE